MSVVQSLSNLASQSVSHVALNPVVTGALLWSLTRGSSNVRDQLIRYVPALRNPERLAQITKILKWLLTLGLAGTVNKTLNEVALNAFRFNNEKKRWKWNEEIAVVTGGCSGIGMLLTRRLILKGVKVAVLDVQQLPPTLQGHAGIKFFSCDITDPTAVASTAKEIKATLGSPTLLVNNAGITVPHTIMKTSPEYLRKIFDVNVLSNWYTIQAFLPDMIASNKGHVVTMASMASYLGVAGMVDYCATKAAILAFHEGLTQEVRRRHKARNILFTSVHPNWVRTPLTEPYVAMVKAAGDTFLEPVEVADAIAAQIFKCSGGQLYLPTGAGKYTGIRGLPNYLQEILRGGAAKVVLTGTD